MIIVEVDGAIGCTLTVNYTHCMNKQFCASLMLTVLSKQECMMCRESYNNSGSDCDSAVTSTVIVALSIALVLNIYNLCMIEL